MSVLQTNRMRAFEAGRAARPDYSGPLRMQGTGWKTRRKMTFSPAWRHAMGQRAIWGRSVILAMIGLTVAGGMGSSGVPAIGAAVFVSTLFVQAWQFAQSRRQEQRVRLN